MNEDPASLANLRDIATPPPVPWLPPAPGWWFLLAALGAAALFFAVQSWRRWRANAYRRAALRELQVADNAASIAELLKRTALVARPRTQVASLTGVRWVEWLAETGGRPVPASVSRTLTLGVFASDDDSDVESLTEYAADWIKHHRGPGSC